MVELGLSNQEIADVLRGLKFTEQEIQGAAEILCRTERRPPQSEGAAYHGGVGQLTGNTVEYSPIRVEIITLRRSWFIWSIAVSMVAWLIYGLSAESARGTPFGVVVGVIGMIALVLPLYCLYKLSMAVEPKRSVAWAMVALQAVPIVGLVAAISLVLKAGRIVKP